MKHRKRILTHILHPSTLEEENEKDNVSIQHPYPLRIFHSTLQQLKNPFAYVQEVSKLFRAPLTIIKKIKNFANHLRSKITFPYNMAISVYKSVFFNFPNIN